MGKFRDAMLRDLLLRELAPSTINAYLRGARELVAHYMRPPDALTREDVCAYLEHLRKRGLSPSSRAVYLSGIRFLYAVTLERPEVVAFLRRPKVPLKKVRVLKGREIHQLMDALPLIQHRALFAVSYGCGLRVSEACQLRIEDIDSERERILVREAKGGKGRQRAARTGTYRSGRRS